MGYFMPRIGGGVEQILECEFGPPRGLAARGFWGLKKSAAGPSAAPVTGGRDDNFKGISKPGLRGVDAARQATQNSYGVRGASRSCQELFWKISILVMG